MIACPHLDPCGHIGCSGRDFCRLIFTEEPHGYSLDGFPIPGVSRVLVGAGYVGEFTAPDYIVERARIRGKAVHEASVAIERGEPVEIPEDLYDEVAPRLKAFERFLADHEDWTLRDCERAGYSEDLYVAGTWDRTYLVPSGSDGSTARIDIKTSCRPYPWWAIQLALYDLIDDPGYCSNRSSLWLRRDGKYELIPYTHHYDYEDAEAAVRVYHFRARAGLIEGPTKARKK